MEAIEKYCLSMQIVCGHGVRQTEHNTLVTKQWILLHGYNENKFESNNKNKATVYISKLNNEIQYKLKVSLN